MKITRPSRRMFAEPTIVPPPEPKGVDYTTEEYRDAINSVGQAAGQNPVGYNGRYRRGLEEMGIELRPRTLPTIRPKGPLYAPRPHLEDPQNRWPANSLLVMVGDPERY